MSVEVTTPTATRKACEHPVHVFKKLDSAGNGVCVCGNLRAFGQPHHGDKLHVEIRAVS